MQVLIDSCFDIVCYISKMLNTQSWKQFITVSKALYALRTEDSLSKRAHPLCYVLRYEIPNLLDYCLKSTLYRELLPSKLCKCSFTKANIELFKMNDFNATNRGMVDALLRSPYMTIELFESTWLKGVPKLKALASNESIPINELEALLPSDYVSNPRSKMIGFIEGLCIRSDVDINKYLGTGYGSFTIQMVIASYAKLDLFALQFLKTCTGTCLYHNPYLTFEELIRPPFDPLTKNWDKLVGLPSLTVEDIEAHPEFPWPNNAKEIARFNPLRKELLLSKRLCPNNIIKAIYSNGIPRLDMKFDNAAYIIAGTDVSFEEVLNAYAKYKDGILYHPSCIVLHPRFDLGTYFTSEYYLEGRYLMSPGRFMAAHHGYDFPLKSVEEWRTFIKMVKPRPGSGSLSLKYSVTPEVIRAFPNHKWCLISILLRPNGVSMFDVIKLHKEGFLTLW